MIGPFGIGAFPPPTPGMQRWFRLKAIYFDENAAGYNHIQVNFNMDSGNVVTFNLPQVASGAGAMNFHVSDWYKPDTPDYSNANVSAYFADNAPYNNAAGIFSLVLEAHDVYSAGTTSTHSYVVNLTNQSSVTLITHAGDAIAPGATWTSEPLGNGYVTNPLFGTLSFFDIGTAHVPGDSNETYGCVVSLRGSDFVGRYNANGQLTVTINKLLQVAIGGMDIIPVKITPVSYVTTNGGQLDPTFNANLQNYLQAAAVQPDGKVLWGGFTKTGSFDEINVGRFNADGSPDASFNCGPNTPDESYRLALQSDGKILVAGRQRTDWPRHRPNLVRLNPDGGVDTSFNAAANGDVTALAVAPSGNIVVAGNFTQIKGQQRNGIARLETSGLLDQNFTASITGTANAIGLQLDGSMVVAGAFSQLNGQPRSRVGRIFGNGSLDTSFTASVDSDVYGLAIQPDGKILLCGAFSQVNGRTQKYLARLNSDGTTDTNFNPVVDLSNPPTLALQPDGKILLGWWLDVPRRTHQVARYNPDGSLDPSFAPVTNESVWAIALQPDGRVLLGGAFTQLNGQQCGHLVRVR